MGKSKKGIKLKSDFTSGDYQISKYTKIIHEKFVPARPGEEYYEVTTEDGKRLFLSVDQKRELDKLKK